MRGWFGGIEGTLKDYHVVLIIAPSEEFSRKRRRPRPRARAGPRDQLPTWPRAPASGRRGTACRRDREEAEQWPRLAGLRRHRRVPQRWRARAPRERPKARWRARTVD